VKRVRHSSLISVYFHTHEQEWHFSDLGKMCLWFISLHLTNFSNNYFIFTLTWPCIGTNFFLMKPTDALISQIYFCQERLHVSGSSSAHHQELSTVHSAPVYAMQVWWHIQVPNIQWKIPDDGQRNCPKHVEILDKNKFRKLVRLLVLVKRNMKKSCVEWQYY
jgi:hypothetical protein